MPLFTALPPAQSPEETPVFDDGESSIEVLDGAAARRQRLEQKRVNGDFPIWMVEQLDQEANRLGMTRQSIIKVWLAERLEGPKSIGVQ